MQNPQFIATHELFLQNKCRGVYPNKYKVRLNCDDADVQKEYRQYDRIKDDREKLNIKYRMTTYTNTNTQ